MSAYAVIMTTTHSEEEAQHIADALVKEGLAACVQSLKIASTYRWEGRIQHEPEVLLLIKGRGDAFPLIRDRIHELHSYEVPEIIQLPIVDGLPEYLDWLGAGDN